MDIISHGLYGGVAFGRKSKISYWKAFFFGVMPDLFSFGLFFVANILTLSSGPDFASGPPDPATIPQYVHMLYDVTHSLVVATVVILCVWFVFKKHIIELLAWPLHILVDIPTHSSAFFPTPFLWPISDFNIDGTSWGVSYIFIPNVILLVCLYGYWYIKNRRSKASAESGGSN
jgi:membrane-bound metal-dependent hydrolase YbcI (DUF457 family)